MNKVARSREEKSKLQKLLFASIPSFFFISSFPSPSLSLSCFFSSSLLLLLLLLSIMNDDIDPIEAEILSKKTALQGLILTLKSLQPFFLLLLQLSSIEPPQPLLLLLLSLFHSYSRCSTTAGGLHKGSFGAGVQLPWL